MRESRDCVVMGGGPAGATFAAILKKYAPDVQVTVLEADRHPRHHVGESTIPVVNGVLRDLEVFDRCYDGRFIRKMGITFVWGKDRTPWDADYLELAKLDPADQGGVINVVGQDFSELMRQELRRDIPLTAVNVLRGEFDALLLGQARHFGADVREGTRVSRLHRDAGGRVCGVDWRDDAGRAGHIEAPFVLDATGLNAIATRGQRIHDPTMSNFAVSGYLSGADWKVVFKGRRDATTVFIATIDEGWIWYFPVADDTMSVGVVTRTEHFHDALKSLDLETFFWKSLRGCPEVAPLVARATLRDDVFPQGRRLQSIKDWSSWTPDPVGPGYAAAGDAAIFIDPVLSSGLTLALQSGHRAAYTFNTLRHRPELGEEALWQAYADYMRGEAGSFLALARYFYGNNRAADSWWWQAHRVLNRAGRLDLDHKQAFTLATAGFFPTPRAISLEIMAPLLKGLAGSDADLFNVYHEAGVPTDVAGAGIQVNVPFRLSLRAEPPAGVPAGGLLDTYWDLVCEGYDHAHRLAAAPCKMGRDLAPVAQAVQRHERVAALLEEVPGLVPHVPADAVRRGTLGLVANAAKKGYITLTP
ncbi:MAG: NAD(P)/FAD-dependent oxidoreductase [bacterium]